MSLLNEEKEDIHIKEYNELIEKIKFFLLHSNNEQKLSIIKQNFLDYMLPKELWEKYYNLKDPYDTKNCCHSLSLYQFYQPKKENVFECSFIREYCINRKLMYSKADKIERFNCDNFHIGGKSLAKNADMLIPELIYPHQNLEKFWNLYEKNCCKMPSKDIYQKYLQMKGLYHKIISFEEDIEKWFEALLEAENDEFVEHTVEYRLGEDLTDKKLWKIFMQFLKKRDPKKMLHAYSKYCRVFFNDTSMINEYKELAGKYGSIAVPWSERYNWENHDSEMINQRCYTERFEYKNFAVEKFCPQKFSSKNVIQQYCPFRNTFMAYIEKHASPNILCKLASTCKFFHLKKPVLCCYSFLWSKKHGQKSSAIKFYQQSIEFNNYDIESYNFEKLFITNVLYIEEQKLNYGLFIPKVFKCTAKYVTICKQKMNLDEILFLIEHVADLSLYRNQIMVLPKKHAMLEDFLKNLTFLEYLGIDNELINLQTFSKLNENPLKQKLKKITIFDIKFYAFEPNSFAGYISNELSSNAEIHLHCRFFSEQQYIQNRDAIDNCKQLIKEAISTSWNDADKPKFIFKYRSFLA